MAPGSGRSTFEDALAATGEPTPTAEEITARHRRNAPTLQVLSPKTIVLTLKNFEDYTGNR